tara:strand:+ start:15 stop:212 length:198 start_codon:yes stop_codon:yes gene_type:complete
MSKFKFRGFKAAVTKYVKSKPIVEVVAEVFAFGFLMPLAVFGWLALVINLVVNGIDPNASFGIYG